MQNTAKQYDEVIEYCQNIFLKKMQDYGTAWRILRPSSLTDQIYIKTQRVRNIENLGKQKINDKIADEYVGIINYSVMALIQMQLGVPQMPDNIQKDIELIYNKFLNIAKSLMMKKNHDYGEAWRYMRTSSYTDLILMKIFRVKQIEDNKGKTTVSEGIDANYLDIINYAVFALIRLVVEKQQK